MIRHNVIIFGYLLFSLLVFSSCADEEKNGKGAARVNLGLDSIQRLNVNGRLDIKIIASIRNGSNRSVKFDYLIAKFYAGNEHLCSCTTAGIDIGGSINVAAYLSKGEGKVDPIIPEKYEQLTIPPKSSMKLIIEGVACGYEKYSDADSTVTLTVVAKGRELGKREFTL